MPKIRAITQHRNRRTAGRDVLLEQVHCKVRERQEKEIHPRERGKHISQIPKCDEMIRLPVFVQTGGGDL